MTGAVTTSPLSWVGHHETWREGALAPSSIMEAFVAPVMRDLAEGITTEISVLNPGPPTEIRWVLRNANGIPAPDGSAVSSIPANGRVGVLIEALFPDADTDDFRGTLTAEVSGGGRRSGPSTRRRSGWNARPSRYTDLLERERAVPA